MCQMAITCSLACKFGATSMAGRFLRSSGLFTLMPQEIAECRELATIATMFPALGFLRSFKNNRFLASRGAPPTSVTRIHARRRYRRIARASARISLACEQVREIIHLRSVDWPRAAACSVIGRIRGRVGRSIVGLLDTHRPSK